MGSHSSCRDCEERREEREEGEEWKLVLALARWQHNSSAGTHLLADKANSVTVPWRHCRAARLDQLWPVHSSLAAKLRPRAPRYGVKRQTTEH